MKTIGLVALVAGLVITPLLIHKCRNKLLPIFVDPNKRYDINEYMTDLGL